MLLATGAGLLLVGWSAGSGAASTAGTAGGPVTDCTSTQARSALRSFVAAYDAGDYRRLDGLFAGPSWFHWYSSNGPGKRTDPEAQKRETLIGYFRARHAQRDRFRLVSFTFNGNSVGYGNFIFTMKRSAADFRDGAWFTVEGKGATLCEGRSVKLTVLSVGGPET
jgi:hypothetical protein